MNKEFWLERWERRETGFHQNEVNPYLSQHWSDLQPMQGNRVFVPLCGKSKDMLWLMQKGYSVIGVELSPIAVQGFFSDLVSTPHIRRVGKFHSYEAEGALILCGDFFDIERNDIAGVGALYDRASLVALPPDMRERYVHHLISLLKPGTKILLITFEYPQHEMSGPPFSVSESEVNALYSDYAEVRLLSKHDVLSENPQFQKRGVSWMQEGIFLLTTRE